MMGNATGFCGFTSEALERYARQLALPAIGPGGQARLGRFSVLVVGVGGLGSAAGFYLAAAGVGRLGLADGDAVELGNLQRQIAHTTADVGRAKVDSAAARFGALNPDVRVEAHRRRVTDADAAALVTGYDFVVEATDNTASKLVVARACHAAGRPYSHAGIAGFEGQALTVHPGRSCCTGCLFGEDAAETAGGPPAGPFGVVPGVLGCLQAAEAIKHATGCGEPLLDRLFCCDLAAMRFRVVPVRRRRDCAVCGAGGIG